jgi:hypothetical protein
MMPNRPAAKSSKVTSKDDAESPCRQIQQGYFSVQSHCGIYVHGIDYFFTGGPKKY